MDNCRFSADSNAIIRCRIDRFAVTIKCCAKNGMTREAEFTVVFDSEMS